MNQSIRSNISIVILMVLFLIALFALYKFNDSLQDHQLATTYKLHKLEIEIDELGNQLYQLNVDLEERVEKLEDSTFLVKRK
jgi:hypothetical protein